MIKFGTGGFRGVIGDDFTRENVQTVAQALCAVMKEDGSAKPVVIGYDNRFMSDYFAAWMAEVFAANGVKTFLYAKPVPTPVVMCATRDMDSDYGVMLTASHNPYVFNGVKLFMKGGCDADVELTDRLEKKIAETKKIKSMPVAQARAKKYVFDFSNIDTYIAHIVSFIDPKIHDNHAKILYDNMCGVGVVGLGRLAEFYNIERFDMIHTNHDAFFNFDLPNPTEETLEPLKRRVVREGYDYAMATDSDGDRLGIIDDKGNYVDNNDILAMLYYYLVKYRGKKGDVVKNCATSVLVDKMAEKLGFKCHETDVGFKNISAKMRETDALIGGESSGGLTCRGYLFGKDSAFSASLFMEMQIVMDKPVSEIVREAHELAGYAGAVVEKAVPLADGGATNAYLLAKKPDFGRKLVDFRHFGRNFKYYFEGGAWALYRFSGTEPMLRLFVEAESAEEAERLTKILTSFVRGRDTYEYERNDKIAVSARR